MTQPFDQTTWKARVAAWWRAHAPDWRQAMQRLGVETAYGMLSASAVLPLLDAYTPTDPTPTLAALIALTSGVGGNLVANVVQNVYDRATAPQHIEREIAAQPELRAEYQRLLNRLNTLEAAQAALGDQWADFEAQLQEELAHMGGTLHVEAKGGIFLGDVQVNHGDLVGRDKNVYHFHAAPAPPDFTPQRKAYLRHVVKRTATLPLRGVDVGAGDPTHTTRPRLAQVYVDLDTTATLLTVEGTDDKSPQALEALAEREKPQPLSVLQAVTQNPYIVLLGDPGSGKSTFVNHLAFCLAQHHLDPGGNWLAHLPGWSEADADLLPIVVTLRDFARWAGAQTPEGEATVGRFLARWLTDRDLADFTEAFCQTLHAGQAVVVFDGLDEIPTGTQRGAVRDAVVNFARTYGNVRIIVTCRTLSYQDPDWQLPRKRFPVFELAPFTEEKIARFIAAWYAELATLGAVRPEEVDTLVARLQEAVERPDIARLAPNPLLLTVMALVHAYRGRLPEARALLYEECTDLLLWRWEGIKVKGHETEGREAQEHGLRRLLAQAALQDVDLKRTLWALAFEAHRGDGGGSEDESTADIAEATLWQALRQLHPKQSLDWADHVVAQVKERAGLLVEREPSVYAFPHRTFQEYLAGSHLSVQADFSQQAMALADEAAFWREVVLLAVGRQVHVMGDVSRPLALVAELCPAACVDDEACWRRAWLAGEVLRETGLNRVRQGQQGRDLLARVQARLCVLVEGGHLAARERAEVGDVLGQLGDPRFDADGFYLPQRYRGAPEPWWGFVKIPAGPFLMGSREDDEAARDNEKPQQTLDIPYDYWMARYPVTVAQFGAFVEAGGYETPDWWTETGWAWRRGEWDSQVENDVFKFWLEQRPADLRGAPMWWAIQQRTPTRPVMGVSWFEAVAYTRWLAGQMHDDVPAGYTVRLATEAEWEKAARCGDARRYPWGNQDWDEARANIEPSGIGHASPVGMYPYGANARGLHDLAGNVWEWTQSLYASYPYLADDGREALDAGGKGSRILRGSAYYSDEPSARCAFRYGVVPSFFNYGFRAVVSLVCSDC